MKRDKGVHDIPPPLFLSVSSDNVYLIHYVNIFVVFVDETFCTSMFQPQFKIDCNFSMLQEM